jgi:hypothetical protein
MKKLLVGTIMVGVIGMMGQVPEAQSASDSGYWVKTQTQLTEVDTYDGGIRGCRQ